MSMYRFGLQLRILRHRLAIVGIRLRWHAQDFLWHRPRIAVARFRILLGEFDWALADPDSFGEYLWSIGTMKHWWPAVDRAIERADQEYAAYCQNQGF